MTAKDCDCASLKQMAQIVTAKDGAAGHFKGFVYEFRGPPPHYACHGSEVPFVLDHAAQSPIYRIPWDQTLSESMLSAWSNFGKDGHPNVTIDGAAVEWKAFTAEEQNVMVWDENIRFESGFTDKYRHGACSFWYNEVGFDTTVDICFDLKNVSLLTQP